MLLRGKPLHADSRTMLNAGLRWHALAGPLPAAVPAYLHPWVGLESSMMVALHRMLGASPSLQLLGDGPGRLYDDEAALLGSCDGYGQAREVVIAGAGQSLIAARTVYSAPGLLRHPGLATLGERPLGDLLFATGVAEWTRRDYAFIDADMPVHALVRQACGPAATACWGRRTVFLLDRQPLLVTEIFLPALRQVAGPAPHASSAQGIRA